MTHRTEGQYRWNEQILFATMHQMWCGPPAPSLSLQDQAAKLRKLDLTDCLFDFWMFGDVAAAATGLQEILFGIVVPLPVNVPEDSLPLQPSYDTLLGAFSKLAPTVQKVSFSRTWLDDCIRAFCDAIGGQIRALVLDKCQFGDEAISEALGRTPGLKTMEAVACCHPSGKIAIPMLLKYI